MAEQVKPFEDDPNFDITLYKALEYISQAQKDGYRRYGDNLAIIGLSGINVYCISKAQRIHNEIAKGNIPTLNNVLDLATYAALMLTMWLMENEHLPPLPNIPLSDATNAAEGA